MKSVVRQYIGRIEGSRQLKTGEFALDSFKSPPSKKTAIRQCVDRIGKVSLTEYRDFVLDACKELWVTRGFEELFGAWDEQPLKAKKDFYSEMFNDIYCISRVDRCCETCKMCVSTKEKALVCKDRDVAVLPNCSCDSWDGGLTPPKFKNSIGLSKSKKNDLLFKS